MPEHLGPSSTHRGRMDASLWLVALQGALWGAVGFVGLLAFLHLGFWAAAGTMAGAVVASLLARRFDADPLADPAARRRLNLRVLVVGLGVGMVAAAVWLAWRLDFPLTLAVGGILFLMTGLRAYRIEAYRQHVIEVADV